MGRFICLLASASVILLSACATTNAATGSGELGSISNPVLADLPPGQQSYLRRLRCSDGKAPEFSRNGSVEIIHGRHVIDAFSVRCAGQAERVIHMDMYHTGYTEMAAPSGFTVLPD